MENNYGTNLNGDFYSNNNGQVGGPIGKSKKPFFLRWWFITIIIVAILIIIGTVVTMNGKKIDWSSLELGVALPEPEKAHGKISTNTTENLSVSIEKVTKEYIKKYKDDCIKIGYTIDSEDSGSKYTAFNKQGYMLELISYKEDLTIRLQAPEKMSNFEWPTSGMATMLPKPKSNLGRISWNNSTNFIVHVGNTTIYDYNEYVKACETIGFIVDYRKGEKTYSAKNAQGYTLSLMYLGANRVEISLKTPADETNTNSIGNTQNSGNLQSNSNAQNNESTQNNGATQSNGSTQNNGAIPNNGNTLNNGTTQNSGNSPNVGTNGTQQNGNNQNTGNTTSNNNGLGKEFKAAMDSYEAFMDEYIAFMKKYKASNGTDLSLISDYSKYMAKYAEVCKDFEKWEDTQMNSAETAYYIDVQTRVNKKLLEAAM